MIFKEDWKGFVRKVNRMLRLRPYKSCDSKYIANWLTDESVFLKWGGERFGSFPISAGAIDDKYRLNNGDCIEQDNFYPMTAFDDSGVVGHFIMRYINGDNRVLRFGWVIVADSKRGKGYGSQMLHLGLKYAFEILGVEKVTIGVFENNIPAYCCYKAVGFREVLTEKEEIVEIKGEKWKVIEMEITKDTYKTYRREP